MIYMLGLMSSCTGPFLKNIPKNGPLPPPPPPIGVQISLYEHKFHQLEGDTAGMYSTI